MAAVVSTCRRSILSVLFQIKVGCLVVPEKDGTETTCGDKKRAGNKPMTFLCVLRDAFWVRLALFADMVCAIASPRRFSQLSSNLELRRISHAF